MTFAVSRLSHLHWNDRLQAKERRNKVTPIVGAVLGGAATVEPRISDDGDLFPVPVRVKPSQHDELSNRIKDCFSSSHANSPNQMTPRQTPLNHMDHQLQRQDGHSSRPSNHIQHPPPPSLPSHPDKEKPGFIKERDSKKKSEGSEHKHKHKDREKEKKRKSSHSEERHPKKKSKSSDKVHSPPPARDQSSLPPPKKITHRSSSVSSDRSDYSGKSSRSSVDKHSGKHGGSHSTGHESTSSSHSKSSKSNKHSSSGGTHHSQSTVSGLSSHHLNASSISQQQLTSNHSHSSSQGATNNNYKGTAHSTSRNPLTGGGKDQHDVNSGAAPAPSSTESSFKNYNSSKSNSTGKTATERDGRQLNGLIRTKPTNLVIPSIHPNQSASIKGEKEDLPIKYILEEMIKPTAEKITEIQTPCKVEKMYISPFSNLPKAIGPMLTDSKSSSKSSSKLNSNPETKEREKLASIKIPVKPNQPANGVIDDLNLSPSASGSDSGSSSGNSSSSSSSSSSGSESSDDDTPEPAAPPILFPQLERSPAPSAVHDQTGSSDMWDLGNFLSNESSKPHVIPSSKPTTKAPAMPTPKFSNLPLQTIKTTTASTPATDPPAKKKRGRPRKEETAKKNADPDFTISPGGKQPPTVTSIVANDRKKRISTSSKSKSDEPKQPKKRGRPPKNQIISKAPLIPSSADDSSSSSTSTPPSPEARPDKLSPVPSLPALPSTGHASVDDEDVDVDVDVDVDGDVVSDQSPSSKHSFQPINPEPLLKPKPEPFVEKPKVEPVLVFAKLEPVSPVDVKPMTFENTKPVIMESNDRKDITSLPICIPLTKLGRLPHGVKLGREDRNGDADSSTSMMVSELSSDKLEKSPSPSRKRKVSSPSPLAQAIIMAKMGKPRVEPPIKTESVMSVTMPDRGHHSQENHAKPPFSSGNKDISRSTGGEGGAKTLPTFENSQVYHERARELKTKFTNSVHYASTRPYRDLFALESVATFLMSGICKELEDPKGIQSVKSYYTSMLHLAESQLQEVTRDQGLSNSHRSIHRCCHALFLYTIAHVKHKCYKLLKDPISSATRRIEEHLKDKNRSGISPHSYPVLPSSSPAAPSPASITSNHSHSSVTSDSGRSSLPPGSTVAVPEQVLKDVGDYMKCMGHLSSAVELYRQADYMKDQPEMNGYFGRLDEEMGYSIGMLTDSKQFVHYINIGCAQLHQELTTALLEKYS